MKPVGKGCLFVSCQTSPSNNVMLINPTFHSLFLGTRTIPSYRPQSRNTWVGNFVESID